MTALQLSHSPPLGRVREQGGLLRAADVRLAVEISSPSTRRTDTMIKHAEYADAGIDLDRLR